MRAMILAAAAMGAVAAGAGNDTIFGGEPARPSPEPRSRPLRRTSAASAANSYQRKTPTTPADFERLRLAEVKRARKAAKRLSDWG